MTCCCHRRRRAAPPMQCHLWFTFSSPLLPFQPSPTTPLRNGHCNSLLALVKFSNVVIPQSVIPPQPASKFTSTFLSCPLPLPLSDLLATVNLAHCSPPDNPSSTVAVSSPPLPPPPSPHPWLVSVQNNFGSCPPVTGAAVCS